MPIVEFAEINRKKNAVIIFLLLAVIAAAGIFYAYFYQMQSELAAERESLTATGTIEARTVMASFKVPGKIQALLLEEGSMVVKGQELAILESRELEAKYTQAEGAKQAAEGLAGQAEKAIRINEQTIAAKIEQAEAALTNARQKFERAKSLHDSGAISDSSFDEASNNLRAAQGMRDEAVAAQGKVEVARQEHLAALGKSQQAQGSLQEAQAYLDNTHLLAPITGCITQKYLDEGEMLNAGTPIMEISDLQHTFVKIFIDEHKIGRVKMDQAAEIKVDAFPGQVFTGKVVWINDAGQFAVQKAINEQYSHDIRSFEVKVDLPNEDLKLKTGMTATVKILEEK